MSPPGRYRVVRRLQPVGTAPVVEAVDEATRGRVTIWPGRPPAWTLPEHPGLARRGEWGRAHGVAVWVEERPEGSLLSDLLLPLPPEEAAMVLGGVVEALAALHAVERAHGDLVPHRVMVGVSGEVVLSGIGLRPGSETADLEALARLALTIGAEPLPEDLDEVAPAARGQAGAVGGAEVAERLGDLARAAVCPLPPKAELVEVVHGQPDEPVLPPDPAEVDPLPVEGAIDEVGFDIGPDEAGRGLLDRTGSSRTGTSLEEPTGALDGADPDEQPRIAVLARIAAGTDREASPERFARLEGTPCETIKALVADEPLDPLPVPDGVPLAGGDFGPDLERTLEVTAVRPHPALAPPEPAPAPPAHQAPTEPTDPGWPSAQRSALVFLAGVALTLIVGALAAAVFFGVVR